MHRNKWTVQTFPKHCFLDVEIVLVEAKHWFNVIWSFEECRMLWNVYIVIDILNDEEFARQWSMLLIIKFLIKVSLKKFDWHKKQFKFVHYYILLVPSSWHFNGSLIISNHCSKGWVGRLGLTHQGKIPCVFTKVDATQFHNALIYLARISCYNYLIHLC